MFVENKLPLVVLFFLVCFIIKSQGRPEGCYRRKISRRVGDDDTNVIDRGDKNSNNGGNGFPDVKTEPPPETKRKKCCPYDFDSSKCRTVNDRIICGFDHNKGRVPDGSKAIDLHNGCFLRGKKLECGYKNGPPFDGIRRPPAWDNMPSGGEIIDNMHHHELPRDYYQHNLCPPQYQPQPRGCQQGYQPTQYPAHSATRCVEIGQRIVCSHNY